MSAPVQPGTALPWRAFAEDLRGGRYWCVNPVAGGDYIVDGIHEDDRGEQDARYIVTACNAFPALVEALEALERYLRETPHHNAPEAAAARAALRLARGETE